MAHGQLIATPITLAMIALRQRTGLTGHLAVPVRRPFTLGTLRLELIPSGRGLGAAALHVDARGRTVLYAGSVRTAEIPNACEAAEVRAADAVVVAAPFGERHHTFPPLDQVADALVEWVRRQLATGATPVIVVDNALDGIEVARQVATEIPVAGSPAVRAAAIQLAPFAPMPVIATPGKIPAVTISVVGERASLSAKAVIALVSARAIDRQGAPLPMNPESWSAHPSARRIARIEMRSSYAAEFAWPFVAGREQLLAWIEQTRARRVFVTGTCAEEIVATLGAKAHVLGPPHQMALFPAETRLAR